MDNLAKQHMIMGKMIPKIIDRYPETEKKFAQFIPDVQFMAKYQESATDNRYARSMVEWNQIAKDAEENTVNEARKKYYGVAPDGKTKIYLTRNQIKKKIDEMKDFDEQYFEHFMRFDLEQSIARLLAKTQNYMQYMRRCPENMIKSQSNISRKKNAPSSISIINTHDMIMIYT